MTKMRTKLVASTLAVVVLGLVAVALVMELVSNRSIEVLNDSLRAQGGAYATRLASDISFAVISNSQQEIGSVLNKFLGDHKNTKGVLVLDKDGQTLEKRGDPIPDDWLFRMRAKDLITENEQNHFYSSSVINNEGQEAGRVILIEEYSAADDLRSRSRLISFLSYLGVLGFLWLGLFFVGRRFSLPLERMVSIARRVAAGDLTRLELKISGSDEVAQLGQAIDQMADAFRQQVGALKSAASRVSGNSSEVLSATAQMASSASEQASAVAQTTSTIEEIKQTGQAAKQGAQKIVESSERSVEVSSKGLGAVDASTAEVKHIREQVETIAQRIEDLRAQVGEVGEIITTVNNIAEQSNLLAVNASIEAAKASEYGRGFAVVAQEVKNLATQSKQATAQVKSTLNSIQGAIEELFSSATTGRARTEVGVKSIIQAGEIIRSLAELIAHSAKDAQQIAISANEQVVGLEQVSLAMNSINQTANENMKSSQQLQQGGERLNSMAQELERLVANYRLDQ